VNSTRISAVAVRLMRQLIRDKRACALMIFAPLLVMTLLAFLLRGEQQAPRVTVVATGTISIFITELERLLEEPDEESSGFELVDLPEGITPKEAIRQGIVDAAIVFPRTFLEDRATGKRSQVDLWVEGADPMRSAEIYSRLRKALPDSLSGLPIFLPADCDDHCAETIPDGPPNIEMFKLFGEDIEQMDFFTPVLPPFFVFFFVFIISGLTFLRERIGGTAERILASPLTRAELVSGYVIGFLPAALVQATIVILFARYGLGGPWGGLAAIVAVLLMALVAECLGVFVSAFARSEFQVFQFIPIVVLPQILLCGIIWPIDGLQTWLRVISYCMPLTYAVEAIRDAAIRGAGLVGVWPDLVVLAGFTLLGVVLAARSVHRAI
jgi:ABC-2 type transport system permease protein